RAALGAARGRLRAGGAVARGGGRGWPGGGGAGKHRDAAADAVEGRRRRAGPWSASVAAGVWELAGAGGVGAAVRGGGGVRRCADVAGVVGRGAETERMGRGSSWRVAAALTVRAGCLRGSARPRGAVPE